MKDVILACILPLLLLAMILVVALIDGSSQTTSTKKDLEACQIRLELYEGINEELIRRVK